MISNIVVTGVNETEATITWTTDEVADSAIDYGLTGSFELGTLSDSAAVTSHSVTIPSLSGGKTYSFRVRSKDAASNEATSSTQTFTTLDLTAPTISAISATDITHTSARITWTTNESATSVVEYGTNVSYGSSVNDTALTTDHSVTLTGLAATMQYHFRVRSVDLAANSALSSDHTFTTVADNPPANVSGLTIIKGDKQLALSWTNPTDTDLAGVRVLECTDTNPSGPNDTTGCTKITDALASSLTRTGLINGNIYYYGVFAFDAAGQFASGAVGSGTPTAPEEDVPPAQPVPEAPSEVPTEVSSGEPAGDGGTSEQPGAAPEVGPETGEGAQPEPGLKPGGQPSGQPGLSDSGAPSLSGAGEVRLELSDLEITVAGGTIILSLGKKGTVDVLPRTVLRLQVSQDELLDVETLTVRVGEQSYLLRLADQPGGNVLYLADITAPELPQLYTLGITAQYADGGTQAVSSFLNVVPWGTALQVIDGEETRLQRVKITLSEMVGGKPVVWDGSPYNQFNPVTTGSDGTFGWYVPDGPYRLGAQTESFLPYVGETFVVSNHIANPRIVMVAVPPKPEKETTTAKVVETVKQAAVKVLNTPVAQTVQETLETVRENKTVQKTVDIATPTIAVTAGASVLVMTVAFDFLPFLQYLFTAPILLLWRRKRKGYGVVYHSVSRLPVDLAVVRLFLVEDETKPGPGRLILSRVTDKQGRFFFLVQPGTYRLTATKAGLRFPTDFLKEVKDDGIYLDVYHGELIRVTEKDAVITPNVPLDPVQVGQTQLSKRAVWQGRLRWLQRLVAISGVLVSIAVLIIRPSVLAAAMVIVQVLVYLLARRLAMPHKPKSWGIVYDHETKRPLASVVARVFEPKYNKLLDTVVTDAKGRYAFLLGPSEYFAVFEKQGYKPTQVRPIDLRGRKGGQDFGVDVEMYGLGNSEQGTVSREQ